MTIPEHAHAQRRAVDDGAPTRWERTAGSRWGSYITAAEERALREASRLAGPPGHAVDVGCEGGRWAGLLVALGWSMTCTDVDPDTLATCARRIPEATCLQVSPADERLPLADASVRLASCMEVHPVAHSAWFAPEMLRVLEPGGLVVTVVWNRASARGWVADRLSRFRDGRPHEYYGDGTYRSWRARTVEQGLEIVDERGLCWFPFGRASDSRLVPAAVRVERAIRLHRLPALSPWVVVTARRP